jgi:hypothetical protein
MIIDEHCLTLACLTGCGAYASGTNGNVTAGHNATLAYCVGDQFYGLCHSHFYGRHGFTGTSYCL